MYSPKKVAERIAAAEREFGITLEYHTLTEVDEFERHLVRNHKYVFDDLGSPKGTQNLDEFESRWMLNEQALVMCDCAYFLTRYAYLRDETGTIMRFKFRAPQRIYFQIISDLRGAGLGHRNSRSQSTSIGRLDLQ